ncbi:MAG TPA: tetratricopeptide repeat protein [Candidatus Udaeobacter sp.]|nr:tetratricopeptide repeat protein [Candidatus Udaeobacter sp.]
MVRSFNRRDWLWLFLLIGLVFVSYAQVFKAGFIWDDESHLTQNPCVVGPLGLKEVWTSERAVYYPLVLTTFWTLHKFVGLSPWPYHLLNVLLHAASAVLLWQVLRQLNVRGAWLGAALWALHPVMVQSVAWVTELKNTQSGFFYLLSIFCFLKSNRSVQKQGVPGLSTPSSRTRGWLLFASSLLCFLLATLSKPSVVMLPAVLLLCIWWRSGKIRRQDVFALAPFLLVSGLASLWTIFEQKFHAGAIGADWEQTLLDRLIVAGRAIWFYLGKLIWPHPLIFIYPRWQVDSAQLTAYLPLLVALAGLLVLWMNRKKWSGALFFAAAYYVVSLFPVLGFFNIYFFRYSFVSDHFQYLASMGPLALAGAGIVTGVSRFNTSRGLSALASKSGHSPLQGSNAATITLPLVTACVAALSVLVVRTWLQTTDYRDVITLYKATLAKNPGCWMAHYNLGIALNERGDPDAAIAHYRQALELRPRYAEAHYNLGRLLAQKGRLDEAITEYDKVLQINPSDANAHNNLGATLFAKGQIDEAIDHYRKALLAQPDYADASCNLASALLSKNDLDGAINYYSACLTTSPNQPEAQYNLASALFRRGQNDEAIVHYGKCLELNPDNADAHANLGSAFLAKGRLQEAIEHYKHALRIAHDNVAAQSNLAWLLATAADASLRNGPEAVALAERAESESSRGENHALVLRILAAAYAEAGRFDEAKKTAEQALQAAQVQGNSDLSTALRTEISLYELGLPYHKQAR